MSFEAGDRLRVNLNPIALEADMAYFGARIEMIRKPKTHYQAAQLKAYRALLRAMEETLLRLRSRI